MKWRQLWSGRRCFGRAFLPPALPGAGLDAVVVVTAAVAAAPVVTFVVGGVAGACFYWYIKSKYSVAVLGTVTIRLAENQAVVLVQP